MIQRKIVVITILLLLASFILMAQGTHVLVLPNREQLSADKVLYVMQDSEGFLWYGTDGGGVCRDDGRQVIVFRCDAEHPNLLGSNTVLCLAETGNRIFIGTTHGANMLDKDDYSIRFLAEVDDRRVDDIIVTSDGHCWLTANKNVYEYSPEGKLIRRIDAGDKYIFRMYESPKGQLLCRQWEGGTLHLDGERFVLMDDKWSDSIDFSRTVTDNQGRQLVTDGWGGCHAVSTDSQKCWFEGTVMTKESALAVQRVRQLSKRPTAVTVDSNGDMWFSTGKDIRYKRQERKEIVVSDTRDVSAMTFTPDGTLWLASIYGQLYKYADGEVHIDEYGSNEYGDGVMAMEADSVGRLVLLSDRYVRIYDPMRKTMRQQSREADNIYMIELGETSAGSRWSQPADDRTAWRMPLWGWCATLVMLLVFGVLVCYILMLRRQRRRFMLQIRSEVSRDGIHDCNERSERQSVHTGESEWLQRAIAQVEAHMSDEGYTVEQLSSDMCMSRMTFYRKIQSATGYTPTEFVRGIRLRRAAELLREGGMSVTEISYATGFSSASYFCRCFRAMFGVAPSQFQDSAIPSQAVPDQ